MLSLGDQLRDARARAVRIELAPGESYLIPPASINQTAACVFLDPDDPTKETAKARTLRVREQARILLGPQHAHLTDRLSEPQITLIVGALYVASQGLSPEDYFRWQESQRELAISATRLELLSSLDQLTIALAAELRRLPSEAAAMPLADAVALLERIRERVKAESEFQAKLHGRTIAG